jgi:hypothetical protein
VAPWGRGLTRSRQWSSQATNRSAGQKLFEMDKQDKAADLMSSLNVERKYSEPGLYLGASVFTAAGWQGSFYPPGMQPREYLSHQWLYLRQVVETLR